MLYHPFANISVDFSNVPVIAIYPKKDSAGKTIPDKYVVNFSGQENHLSFDLTEEFKLKDHIDKCNKNGARFYWLLDNVVINLDLVSVVCEWGKDLFVEYPGASCRFPVDSPEKAEAAHAGYLAYLEREKTGRVSGSSFATPPKEKRVVAVDEDAFQVAMENINKMIGLEAAKAKLRKVAALARRHAAKQEMGMKVEPVSRHMVFAGNPGTGKTTFAREVGRIYHALGVLPSDKVIAPKRDELIGEFTGQTAPKVRAKLEEARGGVLFIDEAYTLARQGTSYRDSYGSEAIDMLVAAMDEMRDELVVIIAGYPEPLRHFIAANEGLKSRFTTYVPFEDYTIDELGLIMDKMAAERGDVLTSDARAHLQRVLEREKIRCDEEFKARQADGRELTHHSVLGSAFGNARDARTLIELAEEALAERLELRGVFNRASMPSQERFRELLTTIAFEDVRDLSLQSLRAAEIAPKRTPGFLGNVR